MIDLNYILPTDYSNIWVVFLIGLIAGISTCGGLLSSFVLGISARNEELNPENSLRKKLQPHLIFNLGRVFFFTLFGFLSGMVGQIFAINNSILGIMILFSSIILIILGLQILEIGKLLTSCGINLNFYHKFLLKYKNYLEGKYTSKLSLFLLGGLTFFLPCGFTQGIQVYSLTLGNPLYSALVLLVFALATIPGLLALATASTFFSARKSSWFFKLVGIFVIYFGITNLFNSFNLLGVNLFLNEKNYQEFTIKNGYQEVSMTQTHKGYFPNILTVKKGVPVRLTITSKNNTTCASYIVMEKFGIRQFLELGENEIEFTPNEIGEFQFSCGMGMHPGLIKVIN